MITKQVIILDDDAPKEEANKLSIILDAMGDVHLSFIPGSTLHRGVRIRTFDGGGSHSELLKAFYELIKIAESTADRSGGYLEFRKDD